MLWYLGVSFFHFLENDLRFSSFALPFLFPLVASKVEDRGCLPLPQMRSLRLVLLISFAVF